MSLKEEFYKDPSLCAHVQEAALEDAGFALWLGEARPEGLEPTRIPFSGEIYQEITSESVDPDGHKSAELRIVKFRMTGDHPELGTLDLTLDTSRPGVVARLRSVAPGQMFPVVHTTRLHVVATSSILPGVLLQNRGAPLEFVSEPSPVWPPEVTIYRLKVPVVFEDRQNPGAGLATASDGAVAVASMSRGSTEPWEAPSPV